MKCKEWGRRPEKGWYQAAGHVKTHYWNGIVTLCGRTWHGWKWRPGTHDKCKKCGAVDMDAYLADQRVRMGRFRIV